MSEIVVVGSFTAQAGKESEALEAFRALVEPTHTEDGCILYALHQGAEDRRRLACVERWSSREALDAHLASPHIQDVLARGRSCSPTAATSSSTPRCPAVSRSRDHWRITPAAPKRSAAPARHRPCSAEHRQRALLVQLGQRLLHLAGDLPIDLPVLGL